MNKRQWKKYKKALNTVDIHRIQSRIPKSLYNGINSRLCALNQRTYTENLGISIEISLILLGLGTIYFAIAYTLFHALWYHIALSIASTVIFVYLCQEYYFEYLEKKIRMELPKCSKKLSHYYTHYKGNVMPALKDTAEKGPASTKNYMLKIRKALESLDSEGKMNELKGNIKHGWLKMLCNLMLFAKTNGEEVQQTGAADSANVIGRNLRRLTNILSFLNIEQGYNDADLFSIELFVFFAPFLFIPLTEWFNNKILIEMGMGDIYKGIEAQTLKAMMFFTANISAVFIHWMRKQQY